MSVIQFEDLVSYQLRSNYLGDIADGVGERLFTLNEGFLNSAPFKSAGWRPNPALIKRTHSPPIPTAVASEYFQAPNVAGLTLEDDGDETAIFGGGGTDTVGPGMATKRRRRREQMEEDDSSDLSDESDDEPDQRAAQKISFSKMPLRSRSGSSPIQSSNLRQATNVSSPRAPPPPRRGSQSALETVKERARRDTVTSSEVSSDNEFDASGFHKAREAARAADRAAKLSVRMNTEPALGIKRQESDLLEDEEDDDDDSDGSDASSAFVGSLDSTTLLQVVDQHLNASPMTQVVGTPPRDFTRRSTIRKSLMPAPLQISLGDLPPPRPMSTIRPLSMIQPRSLISAALNANKTKPNVPFVKFASLSGQGDPNPLRLRIFAPFSNTPSKPFEVLIRRSVHEGESSNRTVIVADLIGLSLWRYNEEKLEPSLPNDKLNVNWWTLRMVEEDGEIDDDFPPFDRKKPLTSFTTANNRAGRARSNLQVYDIFGLVQASEAEFAENQSATPQYGHEEAGSEAEEDQDLTPKNTPKPDTTKFDSIPAKPNPLLNTFWHGTTVYADVPSAPPPTAAARSAATRGEKKLLRIHMHSTDIPPGQMVTLDVTTDKYLQEILEEACRKRQLDVASHVLKFQGSGLVVPLDQPVSSIGSVADLDLYRRRFGTDGVLTMTGSGSPSSSSPRILGGDNLSLSKAKKKIAGPHPLAREALVQKDLGLAVSYKKYTVNRRGRMRMGLTDTRSFSVDGEYIHITDANGKKSTIHFSSVLGCKVSRKHPTHFKFTVYRDPREPNKVYDFEARNAEEAAEIVARLQKGLAPYRDT